MEKSSFPHELKCSYLISSADVDYQANLTPGALINFFIQTAWQHAEQLKFGVDDLKKHNLAWVLSGIKIKMLSYPQWKEYIEILTWPKGTNRLFYLRDFLVFNSRQEIIARATSSWLLIDITKRRPKAHDMDNTVFACNKDRHAISELIQALEFEGSIENSFEYTVRHSDIDVNHHLTTTRYINLIFDVFHPDFYKNHLPSDMTMSFLKEIVYGQQVLVQQAKSENGTYNFQLITRDQEKPHFLCRVLF